MDLYTYVSFTLTHQPMNLLEKPVCVRMAYSHIQGCVRSVLVLELYGACPMLVLCSHALLACCHRSHTLLDPFSYCARRLSVRVCNLLAPCSFDILTVLLLCFVAGNQI